MTQPKPVPGLVNIDGVITPISEGRIPVLDHGFLFGDSIYERLRTYKQKPFLFARHFERLRRSPRAVFLHLPWSREHVYAEVPRTLQAAGESSGHRVRITVTRG